MSLAADSLMIILSFLGFPLGMLLQKIAPEEKEPLKKYIKLLIKILLIIVLILIVTLVITKIGELLIGISAALFILLLLYGTQKK